MIAGFKRIQKSHGAQIQPQGNISRLNQPSDCKNLEIYFRPCLLITCITYGLFEHYESPVARKVRISDLDLEQNSYSIRKSSGIDDRFGIVFRSGPRIQDVYRILKKFREFSGSSPEHLSLGLSQMQLCGPDGLFGEIRNDLSSLKNQIGRRAFITIR